MTDQQLALENLIQEAAERVLSMPVADDAHEAQREIAEAVRPHVVRAYELGVREMKEYMLNNNEGPIPPGPVHNSRSWPMSIR